MRTTSLNLITARSTQATDEGDNCLSVSRYKVIKPEDGGWGSELSDGTWSGMIGQVVNKV